MRIHWSPQALHQAGEIIDYLAADRPNTALNWLEGLERRLAAIPAMPEQGRVVPEWHEPTVREVIYKCHRIIYEVHTDRIEVLIIRHSRQDFPDPP